MYELSCSVFLLTTDSFINAYRRFVSIRGKVNVLRSYCGSNFIGAGCEIRYELEGFDINKVRAHCLNTMMSQIDDECLDTFLCETAAIMNNRPLPVYNLAYPAHCFLFLLVIFCP